jgi:molybdenum cofactor guanylyltransferase
VRLLGAIIAGGQARRFGSEKALAVLNGKALMQHVIDALRPQVDDIISCGRIWPQEACVADMPQPGLGPLGGLCAALHYAAAENFDGVLSAPCDVLPVPDMRSLIGDKPAVVAGHYLFGYWPSALASKLAQHLGTQSNHAMKAWMLACNAQEVESKTSFHNFNTQAEFMLYQQSQGHAL